MPSVPTRLKTYEQGNIYGSAVPIFQVYLQSSTIVTESSPRNRIYRTISSSRLIWTSVAINYCSGQKQKTFCEYLRHSNTSLPDFVRLLRGETSIDPRPNKALEVPRYLPGWSTYRYSQEWEEVVIHGVIPEWRQQFEPQATPPSNHTSASVELNSLVKSIRTSQDKDPYLVIDLDLVDIQPGIPCSPFGAVLKGS
ncbi:Hypothetical protein PHPALM_9013 [Phytophthora palmivora]|uniref:Uncharacterized protein n=1 Tax=Phytophthora palmivora TaxID=4796 RepID=A0A2P4Y8S3_9STRA|nr:Hypothetical protein PHPALM_9013 [Phytophthora palmivora]